jgi:glutathionylspermidine synthase
MEAAFGDYKSIVQSDPELYYQDYQLLEEKLADSHAYYKGQVIPFLYQPFFFSNSGRQHFSWLIEQLSSILDKVIQRYISEPEFRSYFKFSSELEELILVEPGYEADFPMARFDIFAYDEQNIKFCEFNADGSSGMVKTNILDHHFLDSKAIKELQNDYQFDYFEMTTTWIDTILDCYQQFSDGDSNPNIAIMDFDNYGMVGEFKHFKDLLLNQGYNVKILDPRELEYRNNNLYSGNYKIDLIYRRAVTTDLMDHYQQLGDLWEAYRSQDVCLVGPIRSQIIHNKILFAILGDPEKVSFLTASEHEFIEQYIPTTELIEFTSSHQESIINRQEELVLKPLDDYGSNGVLVGQDVTTEEWSCEVQRIIEQEEMYLTQQFCSLPEKELAQVEAGGVEFANYKFILGLFVYNQEFKGIYTRAAKQNVIASSTGCVTLANFIVE